MNIIKTYINCTDNFRFKFTCYKVLIIVVGRVPKLFVINMNATMHYVAATRVVFGGDPGAVQTWRVMIVS